jgi:hypothetical protein
MTAADLGKIFVVTAINVAITFLNAVFQPFTDTIFALNDWQPVANKSAIAVGFIVILVVAAVKVKSEVTIRAILGSAIATFTFAAMCIGIHFTLASGHAPTPSFLFWIRDVLWMIVYILMLLFAGITVGLACLRMFGNTP